MKTKSNNTLFMMRMFQTYYDCRAVVFTTTPRIIEVCNSLGITTSSNMTLNPFGLPYIGSMYHAAASLFDGAFYGYINADILLSTSFMEVLSFIESQRSSHSRDTLIEVCHNAYNVRAPKLSAAMQPSAAGQVECGLVHSLLPIPTIPLRADGDCPLAYRHVYDVLRAAEQGNAHRFGSCGHFLPSGP